MFLRLMSTIDFFLTFRDFSLANANSDLRYKVEGSIARTYMYANYYIYEVQVNIIDRNRSRSP